VSHPKIRNIRARALLAPVKRPVIAATGEFRELPLVLVDLETDQGITGRAYVFGYASMALKPLVEAVHGLAQLVQGDPCAPLAIEAKLRKRLTLLGTPGITGIALAGIDMCAWDAAAQAQGVPLVEMLGGQVQAVRAYNSCGLWHMPIERLADEAEQLVAEGGFSAVKLRVGRNDPDDDVRAAREVKKRVGDRVAVMCDFNQKLTVNEAILRGRQLDDEGLYWIEEPTRHDDYAGYARIAAEVRTPIQTGENLLNTFELLNALRAQAMDYVMPDVQRIGGVTGWLRAAAICHAYGIEMSSHLFPEYSAHLLAGSPTCHWLEYVDWAAQVLFEPIQVKDGHVLIPNRPGAGIAWNEQAVKRFLVA
jgi:mandelate racemase